MGRMVAGHFHWRAACRPAAAILLSLCTVTSTASHADSADSRTVIVALDRDAYLARDLTLLENQVTEAAQSQFDRIAVSGSNNKDEIRLTIYDLTKDVLFPHMVEKEFANRPGFAVSQEPEIGRASCRE